MIRIYLDWNVVSNLKRPENKEIKEFIDQHKNCFLFPYSPAHFNDLMKSYSPDNQYFNQDLEMLEYLSEKHLIRWDGERTEPLFGTPKEYFEGKQDNPVDVFALMDMENLFSDLDEMDDEADSLKLGAAIKYLFNLLPAGIEVNDVNRELLKKIFPNITSNSSIGDLMKDISPFTKNLLQNKEYYKDFRKSIREQGLQVDANSGNWVAHEVIDNIDKFLKGKGVEMTFIEYIEQNFNHRKESVNRYEFFTTAYLMLDMMGYKSDKLPKPTDNMQNIQTDSEHSFYAAHCDFFVVGDEKLRIKSKVLYNKFNIQTTILQPNELVRELEKVIYTFPQNGDFIGEAFNYVKNNEVVEFYPSSEEIEADTYAIKLPIFYFNFFTHVVFRYYPSQNGIVLTFKKASKNYSDFIYSTEAERLIDRIVEVFGYDDYEELNKIKKILVYGDKEAEIVWSLNRGAIKIEKDEYTDRPILSYFFTLNEENENSD